MIDRDPFRRAFTACSLLVAGLMLTGAAPRPGSEIVVILDNSGSMAKPVAHEDESGAKRQVPANDPDRLAVLGALSVLALSDGSQDRVTVIGFGEEVVAEVTRPLVDPAGLLARLAPVSPDGISFTAAHPSGGRGPSRIRWMLPVETSRTSTVSPGKSSVGAIAMSASGGVGVRHSERSKTWWTA